MARAVKQDSSDRSAYQAEASDDPGAKFDDQLARLVRVGLEGNAAGMRQLVDRLVRLNVPGPRKGLRDALALAVAQTETPFVPFRASDELVDDWASYEGPQRSGSAPVAAPPPTNAGDGPRARHLESIPDGLTFAPPALVEAPLLSSAANEDLADVVEQHRHAERLLQAGMYPTRTVLLTGAPGTGKTHTATWLPAMLERPLLTLDLARLIAHELGRSARNLQAALRAAARTDAVLFIDELDALGRARAETGDVGEMKRLVNVFLLELEQWPNDRLLVSATNHPQLLDPAVSRRFERRIELSLPDAELRRRMLDRFLPELYEQPDGDAIAQLVVHATEGWTGAALEGAARNAGRNAVLRGGSVAELLMREVLREGSLPSADRDGAIGLLSGFGMSQRRVAALLGVSHPTVGAVLRKASSP